MSGTFQRQAPSVIKMQTSASQKSEAPPMIFSTLKGRDANNNTMTSQNNELDDQPQEIRITNILDEKSITTPATAMAEDDDSFLDWETRNEKIPIGKHIIAGSCAGIMEHVGMFPMDTIKTHQQASGNLLGIRSIARTLIKDEGFVRFYKGANVMASGCVPAHACYFLAYEHLKKFCDFDNNELNLQSTLFIGGFTTFAHDFFIAPADVMKQRMQLRKSLTGVQCFKNIMKEEGIRGLYRSYPLTVMMNIPFASCVVCCNENLKTIIRPWDRQFSTFWYFVCAGFAGGLAGFITNPLDVIKTRLQTQEVKPSCKGLRQMWEHENAKQLNYDKQYNTNADGELKVKSMRYTDLRATFKYIYRTEGLIAFTKGILPRMSINVPATALSWGTYETIKSFLIDPKDLKD